MHTVHCLQHTFVLLAREDELLHKWSLLNRGLHELLWCAGVQVCMAGIKERWAGVQHHGRRLAPGDHQLSHRSLLNHAGPDKNKK